MAKGIRSKRQKRLRSIKRRTWLKAKEENVLRVTRAQLAKVTGAVEAPVEGEDMIHGLTGYAKSMAESKQTTKGNQVHFHPHAAQQAPQAEDVLAAAAAGEAVETVAAVSGRTRSSRK